MTKIIAFALALGLIGTAGHALAAGKNPRSVSDSDDNRATPLGMAKKAQDAKGAIDAVKNFAQGAKDPRPEGGFKMLRSLKWLLGKLPFGAGKLIPLDKTLDAAEKAGRIERRLRNRSEGIYNSNDYN